VNWADEDVGSCEGFNLYATTDFDHIGLAHSAAHLLDALALTHMLLLS
jgi:hypothetical protein